MKILVIDNGTSYLNQLVTLLNGECEIITYSQISKKDVNSFDAIILSGGHGLPVVGSESRLAKEIALIKNSQKPILGICYGFELIASVFGSKLTRLQNKERGILDIEVTDQGEIFKEVSDFRVFESHRWVVIEVGSELLVLARSKDGIEAIKHKTRPIYGVQFHPEMFIEKTCGRDIFNNFLGSVQGAITK